MKSLKDVDTIIALAAIVGARRLAARSGKQGFGNARDIRNMMEIAQTRSMERLKGEKAEISTVDKFQGREAAVAIFSLTSSSGIDAPRGLNFLLEPNRLNVAISRAKCLSIIVGSEDLLSSSVNSIDDAKLLNNICMINSQNEKNLLM